MPAKRLSRSGSGESLANALEESRSVKAKRTAPEQKAESLPAKIVERVLPKLDLDQLADGIAAKLSEEILTSLKIDTIVATLLEKFGGEVEEALTSAIIERM